MVVGIQLFDSKNPQSFWIPCRLNDLRTLKEDEDKEHFVEIHICFSKTQNGCCVSDKKNRLRSLSGNRRECKQ